MAKQTFTTGQVLTAAQMTSLQQTAMGGGSATAKTASYVLVAADAGTTVIMNAAGATTITVNTSLFSAGDTVFIQNIGAGTCTITAGTATVNTASSLALAQYDSGSLYFTATSASIFSKADGASAGGGGKVLQVVQGTTSTVTTISTSTLTDTGLTATITPSLATSKILVLASQLAYIYDPVSGGTIAATGNYSLLRGATNILDNSTAFSFGAEFATMPGGSSGEISTIISVNYLDSPSTTSATTYKLQARLYQGTDIVCQRSGNTSTIILLEIGA